MLPGLLVFLSVKPFEGEPRKQMDIASTQKFELGQHITSFAFYSLCK